MRGNILRDHIIEDFCSVDPTDSNIFLIMGAYKITHDDLKEIIAGETDYWISELKESIRRCRWSDAADYVRCLERANIEFDLCESRL